jgi:hypothetical protein
LLQTASLLLQRFFAGRQFVAAVAPTFAIERMDASSDLVGHHWRAARISQYPPGRCRWDELLINFVSGNFSTVRSLFAH